MISKYTFLHQELFSMSFSAMVQHNKIYKTENENLRTKFKEQLFIIIKELTTQYKTQVSDDVHIENIQKIITYSNLSFSNLLIGEKLRFGTAQKVFNLYLKYMWSIDQIIEPPHCPIDRLILSRIPRFKDVKWTQLDDVEIYLSIINEIKKQLNGITIGQWELNVWDKLS